MPADLARIKDLFLAVLDMPAAERAAYLDAACAGDTAVRRQIEAMVLSHEDSGELLGAPEELLENGGATQADATAAFAQQARPSATQTEPAHAGPDDLAFLAPSARPGHLGRLGHYEVREVIGKGGFGVVLKGFDERLHRVVAIKVLSPAYAANGSARQRFIREARAAAAVKNEHVVGIYDVEDDAQPPYFVMEMIDGESLQAKLDRSGSLGVKEVLRIGMQIAEGLAVAHKQGLVHRDIKPANILLDNGVERVKLTDFGLARAVDDASITQSGTVAGTPMYMSPEQAEGLPIDHRSDLFSLGTVLYTMCTGRTPFRASGTHAVLKRVIDASPRPIREINNEIPDWLCHIIARLHARRPEDRFQTAQEVAEVLGQQLAHLQQPMTVPMPAVPVPVGRSEEARSDDGEATFPVRLMPRDIVDVMLAGLLVPLVIAMFWVPPVATIACLTSLAGLGALGVVAGLVVGTMLFIGVLFVVGLDAQRAVVSRRGIELVRDAGAPTLIRWRDLRRVAEATRWEVFRRVWLWPGLPPRGSIMGMSTLHHFRIEWQGGCYYFAPADPAAFAQAVAFFRSQVASEMVATAAETDSASRVETPTQPSRGPIGKWGCLGLCIAIVGIAALTVTVGAAWWVVGIAFLATLALVLFGLAMALYGAGNRIGSVRLGVLSGCCVVLAVACSLAPLWLDLAADTSLVRTQTDEPGWVQLFNGKDLAGWTKHPQVPGFWRVDENGWLVGSGPVEYTFLATERGDFEDFQLRVEVQVDTPQSDSGVFFRVGFPNWDDFDEAQICADPARPTEQTGGLLTQKGKQRTWVSAAAGLTAAKRWFTLEVIARGDHIITKVNGKVAVETHTTSGNRRGHILLQQAGGQTTVRFKKIEIRELPATPPLAVAPFDAADAKEHQDAWAKQLGIPVEIENSIGMKLRLIPAGEFMMGTPAPILEQLLSEAKDGSCSASPRRAVG